MKVGILGTGMVGRAHAAKLAELGHEVYVGTQDVHKTMSTKQRDVMGNPPFSKWQSGHKNVRLVTFQEAAKNGEIVYNVLHGLVSVNVLKGLRSEIGTKVIIDITNPLDFSKGMPPRLSVCNDDSLGEQIQAVLPSAKVVKTLNTTNANVQINPMNLQKGNHHMFICGNSGTAKKKVQEILKDWYGWKNIIDLGDITSARGMEMMMPVWLQLYGSLGTANFNYKIVSD